jgi:hypothetical protein
MGRSGEIGLATITGRQMAKYLGNDEVGNDGNCIGFPNLGGCMAVVLVTTRGMYGYHMMPGSTDKKVPLFAGFISNYESDTAINRTHLYGSCNRLVRYHDKDMSGTAVKDRWKAEMREVATLLGFSGKITGYDASCRNRLEDKEAVYIEYRREAEKCNIFYKRMGKMSLTKPGGVTDLQIQRIQSGGWFNAPSIGNPIEPTITGAGVYADSSSGELHSAGLYGVNSFTV